MKRASCVERFSSLYQRYLEVPSVTSATLLPGGVVQVQQAQGSLSQETSRKFMQSFVRVGEAFAPAGFPSQLSEDRKSVV